MKVALVNLTSGGMSGGYQKYLAALLPRLAADPRLSELTVLAPASVGLPPGAGYDLLTWTASDAIRDPRTLAARLSSLKPDVVFFPTARLVRLGTIPTVVMVRNMEPLRIPFGGNPWLEGLRNLARARAARVACHRASRVIAVSQHVRAFVVDRWSVPEERVAVVYHGIDPPASGPRPVRPACIDTKARFLFTAGSIRPARGLEDAIRALPMLRRHHHDVGLVIAGSAGDSGQTYAAKMRRLAVECGVEGAVTWAGTLTTAEMAWAYDHCAAFLVTSRAEACPNVALEAMSHGARIVSTTEDPMPEFFRDVAVYYPPREASTLAHRINEVLGAGSEHRMLNAQARQRAAGFTWAITADRTIQELARAVGAASPRSQQAESL